MEATGSIEVGFSVIEPAQPSTPSWNVVLRTPLTTFDRNYASSVSEREEYTQAQVAIAIAMGRNAEMLPTWRTWLNWFSLPATQGILPANVSRPATSINSVDLGIIVADISSNQQARHRRIQIGFCNALLTIHPDQLTAEQVSKLLFSVSDRDFSEVAASITGNFEQYSSLRQLIRGGMFVELTGKRYV